MPRPNHRGVGNSPRRRRFRSASGAIIRSCETNQVLVNGGCSHRCGSSPLQSVEIERMRPVLGHPDRSRPIPRPARRNCCGALAPVGSDLPNEIERSSEREQTEQQEERKSSRHAPTVLAPAARSIAARSGRARGDAALNVGGRCDSGARGSQRGRSHNVEDHYERLSEMRQRHRHSNRVRTPWE